MRESFNDGNENPMNDEKLSTADLVNRSRATEVLPNRITSEKASPVASGIESQDQILDESEEDIRLSSDRTSSNEYPVERIPVDPVSVDRIDSTRYEPRNGHDVTSRVSATIEGESSQSNQLFDQDELKGLRSHWDAVQTSFVDEPRTAVKQADSLVANVVARIAQQFATERGQLEKQWDRGEAVDTEDLRQAFKRYRAFFDRLLAF